MKKVFFILGMAAMASVCFIRVGAAAPDKTIFLQDENFFLQDEIRKLQAELIDKDNAFKKLLLERETVRQDLGRAVKEKEALEEKIASLTKMVASCDDSIRHHAEQAVMPYRSQLKDAAGQLKVMAMTLEEKNVRAARAADEQKLLKDRVEMLTAEKLSLLQSMRKISGEYNALKGEAGGRLSDVKAEADAKVKDFQIRLAAEQTLVQEKISQAKKPLEKKIVDAEAACQAREAQAVLQGKSAQALVQEKVLKLEEQIILLRENAGLEVRKVEEQLNICRKALQNPPAAKK